MIGLFTADGTVTRGGLQVDRPMAAAPASAHVLRRYARVTSAVGGSFVQRLMAAVAAVPGEPIDAVLAASTLAEEPG